MVAEAHEHQHKVDELSETVDKLQTLCDASVAQETFEKIKELYSASQVETTTRLARMEEMVGDWEECQSEVAAVSQWVESAREVTEVRITPVTLRKQLQAQEVRHHAGVKGYFVLIGVVSQ